MYTTDPSTHTSDSVPGLQTAPTDIPKRASRAMPSAHKLDEGIRCTRQENHRVPCAPGVTASPSRPFPFHCSADTERPYAVPSSASPWSKAGARVLLCPAHGGLREAFGVAHQGDGLAEVGGGVHYALPGLHGGGHCREEAQSGWL